MVNKVPGMKTNEGSQVTRCQGGRQGEEKMLWVERQTEREVMMERYKAPGRERKKKKCSSEEAEKQEVSEGVGGESGDGDSIEEERIK